MVFVLLQFSSVREEPSFIGGHERRRTTDPRCSDFYHKPSLSVRFCPFSASSSYPGIYLRCLSV